MSTITVQEPIDLTSDEDDDDPRLWHIPQRHNFDRGLCGADLSDYSKEIEWTYPGERLEMKHCVVCSLLFEGLS
jgi:hypothetical protein